MGSSHEQAVRTPFSLTLRFWARRFGALAVWLILAAGVACALTREPRSATAPGVAELVKVSVSPPADGIVAELAVDLLEEVKAGQVVALMDDRLVAAELATATAGLEQLRAQLDAERERMH